MADMVPASRIVSVVAARVQSAHDALKQVSPPHYERKAFDEALSALGVAQELLALMGDATLKPVESYGTATVPTTLGMPQRAFAHPSTLSDVEPAFDPLTGPDDI